MKYCWDVDRQFLYLRIHEGSSQIGLETFHFRVSLRKQAEVAKAGPTSFIAVAVFIDRTAKQVEIAA